ncbi:hypothetical protein H4582DRAFT_1974802 [Lactarius indigo]|nr:hypothetical protein H4582DRAFT_1974802 [Lactarius indigo]
MLRSGGGGKLVMPNLHMLALTAWAHARVPCCRDELSGGYCGSQLLEAPRVFPAAARCACVANQIHGRCAVVSVMVCLEPYLTECRACRIPPAPAERRPVLLRLAQLTLTREPHARGA